MGNYHAGFLEERARAIWFSYSAGYSNVVFLSDYIRIIKIENSEQTN